MVTKTTIFTGMNTLVASMFYVIPGGTGVSWADAFNLIQEVGDATLAASGGE